MNKAETNKASHAGATNPKEEQIKLLLYFRDWFVPCILRSLLNYIFNLDHDYPLMIFYSADLDYFLTDYPF